MTSPDKHIQQRKQDHLRIVAEENVRFKHISAGFEHYRFVHNALPELNFSEIDSTTPFLGYSLGAPLVINPMSGGVDQGKALNRALAEVAQAEKIALGLGSLRPALEDETTLESFRVARESAPDIPILANIGAIQLKSDSNQDQLSQLLSQIGADALTVHLNPLQEVLQPEGEPNFAGVLRALEQARDRFGLPLIIKEVGCGLSKKVLQKLAEIGIKWVDVSGAGGTSFAQVEEKRSKDPVQKQVAKEFSEWGIPTVESLRLALGLQHLRVIASGGVESGIHFAKAIALGSALVGVAAPVLQAWHKKKAAGVQEMIQSYKETLKIAQFCTGCKSYLEFCGNLNIIREVK